MKKIVFAAIAALALVACNTDKAPQDGATTEASDAPSDEATVPAN